MQRPPYHLIDLPRIFDPRGNLTVAEQLKDVPFDIVHAQSPFLAGQEALRIARKRDIPLVSTFHSKYYDDALAKTHSEALAKMVVKWIVNLYDKCDAVWTVNNESTMERMIDLGVDNLITDNIALARQCVQEAERSSILREYIRRLQ